MSTIYLDTNSAIPDQEADVEQIFHTLSERPRIDAEVKCTSINKLLARTQNGGQDMVERLLSQLEEEPTDEMVQKVMAQHHVADDGGVPLFHFCINPRSFGQSVENLSTWIPTVPSLTRKLT